MLNLPYSLVIEATDDPTFFGFYSDDLPGFAGVGHSVEDCIYQARHGMAEHVEALREQEMSVPIETPRPTILIHDAAPVAA